jgi:sugar phosphate isomerase/epimerase
MIMRKELTRRRFIAAAGLGAVGVAGASHASLLSGVAPPEVPQRKFYTVLSLGALGLKGSFQQSVELAVKYGFEGVDPDFGYFSQLSDDQLKKLVDELKAKNLKLGGAGLPVDFRQDEQTFSEDLKKLPAAAGVLQAVGVTRVTTWIVSFSNDLTYLQNFREHACRLRPCAEVLWDHGQHLGLEYVGPKTSWRSGRHPFVHTLSETKELITAIGTGNLGVRVDSYHWFNAEETEADLLTLRDQDVVTVDLNDAPAGIPLDKLMDLSRELPAATGVIPVKTFLDGLLKIGYEGPVQAEPFNAALSAMPIDQACSVTAAAIKKAFSLAGVS